MSEIKEIPLPKLIKPWDSGKINDYAFINANVIDVETGKCNSDMTVLTSDGLISEMGENIDIDQTKYTVVDCEGRFLCPGLIDCHVHISIATGGEASLSPISSRSPKFTQLVVDNACNLMLSRGFTTVRDTGGLDPSVRRAINDDLVHGPRVYYSGMALSQTGGHGDFRGPGEDVSHTCQCHVNSFGRVCDGVPACLEAARNELRKGADFIKIMGGGGVASPSDSLVNLQFNAEEIKAITTVADFAETYVTAHAYTPQAIKHCVENGVRGIEHGNFIDESTATLMAKTGTFLTPTLITYKIMGSQQFSDFLSPSSKEKNAKVLEAGVNSLLVAKKAGVKVCYGSDLLGPLGGYQSGEFTLRSEVLSPLEVLQQATINPADMLREPRLGQIKEGNFADMIILEKNPLDDITLLDNHPEIIRAVLKNGRVYKSTWNSLPTDVVKP
jgi:imidazolonepropionase-like amidohydrolase